jgi:hypothetical protein
MRSGRVWRVLVRCIKNMFLSQKWEKKVPAHHGSPRGRTGPVRASPPHPSGPSDPAAARPHLSPTFVPRHPSNSHAKPPHMSMSLSIHAACTPHSRTIRRPSSKNSPPPHHGEAQQHNQFASIKENEKKKRNPHTATAERITNLSLASCLVVFLFACAPPAACDRRGGARASTPSTSMAFMRTHVSRSPRFLSPIRVCSV